MKPLSETRWECKVKSVKAIRYQPVAVCDALDEVAITTENPQAKSDAESLINEMINHNVSKDLQHYTMDITTGISSFQNILNWLMDLLVL